MNKSRRFIILLFSLIMLLLPVRASAQPDYIRLHVVAASDSLSDQAIKLAVRDGVRKCAAALLADCADPDSAYEVICAGRDELLAAAQEAARAAGYTGSVSAETGVFSFPDRTYGDELVPAGDYRALRIVLGEGEGRNWWCVIYPSLCLPEDADTDLPVEFYSSVCRWARQVWEAIFND